MNLLAFLCWGRAHKVDTTVDGLTTYCRRCLTIFETRGSRL